MKLYIRSSVNCYAYLNHVRDHTGENLSPDEVLLVSLKDINKMAIEFNVFVGLELINEGRYVFAIHNKPNKQEKCIYGYEAFEMNLEIEDDESFEKRVQAFLFKFYREENFEQFHHLVFSSIAKRHFVTT